MNFNWFSVFYGEIVISNNEIQEELFHIVNLGVTNNAGGGSLVCSVDFANNISLFGNTANGGKFKFKCLTNFILQVLKLAQVLVIYLHFWNLT